METKLYIKLRESKETGYISVERSHHENEMESVYNNHIEFCKNFNINVESFESFKLNYLYVNVKFDGRKGVTEQSVIKSLEKQGYIKLVSEGGMFGGYYHKTDKLNTIMQTQLSKRKELAGVA